MVKSILYPELSFLLLHSVTGTTTLDREWVKLTRIIQRPLCVLPVPVEKNGKVVVNTKWIPTLLDKK
jgi:hypothetical protein